MCYGASQGSEWVPRRYYTREERQEWLKQYADELDAELKAVRERIADLAEG